MSSAENKPRRQSAEQTRNRLIEAAVEQLDMHGAPARLDHVSLEELIKLTGVPRSSAYSAWEKVSDDQTPQESFRRALIKKLIVSDGHGSRDLGPLEEILPIVLERTKDLPVNERRQELIRMTAGAQFQSAFVRPGYRVSIALTTATISAPPEEVDQEILAWLQASEKAFLAIMVELFQGLAELLELVPAPEFDPETVWEIFVTTVLALGEGLFGRMSTSKHNYLVDIPGPGPAGTTEPWTLYALAIDAIADRFFIAADAAT